MNSNEGDHALLMSSEQKIAKKTMLYCCPQNKNIKEDHVLLLSEQEYQRRPRFTVVVGTRIVNKNTLYCHLWNKNSKEDHALLLPSEHK